MISRSATPCSRSTAVAAAISCSVRSKARSGRSRSTEALRLRTATSGWVVTCPWPVTHTPVRSSGTCAWATPRPSAPPPSMIARAASITDRIRIACSCCRCCTFRRSAHALGAAVINSRRKISTITNGTRACCTDGKEMVDAGEEGAGVVTSVAIAAGHRSDNAAHGPVLRSAQLLLPWRVAGTPAVRCDRVYDDGTTPRDHRHDSRPDRDAGARR